MRCRLALCFLALLAIVFAPDAFAAGALTGSSVAITTGQTVNLTALGIADWAHWGLNANNTPGEFDHKAVGGTAVGLISNYTILGGSTINGFPYNLLTCAWSNGAPTASASTLCKDYTLSNANGSGFRFSAPADTTTCRTAHQRTLSILPMATTSRAIPTALIIRLSIH